MLFTDRYVRKSVCKNASKYVIKKSEAQNMFLEDTRAKINVDFFHEWIFL